MSSQTDLVEKYQSLSAQKARLESELAALQSQIEAYCQEHRLKTLRSSTHLLSIVKKIRTVFPSKSSASRLDFDKLIASMPSLSKFSTTDIVALGAAYDKRTLPQAVLDRLQPYVRQKPFLRVSLLSRKIKKGKQGQSKHEP